ncbi:MAG: hypothetical protein ACI90V_004416 [Bacillariaceae sp.]|jgi:hypothetical protein
MSTVVNNGPNLYRKKQNEESIGDGLLLIRLEISLQRGSFSTIVSQSNYISFVTAINVIDVIESDFRSICASNSKPFILDY